MCTLMDLTDALWFHSIPHSTFATHSPTRTHYSPSFFSTCVCSYSVTFLRAVRYCDLVCVAEWRTRYHLKKEKYPLLADCSNVTAGLIVNSVKMIDSNIARHSK